MPKILMINGYQVSIWSNENGEPMHVHVSKRKPSANSPKFWLLSDGTFIAANPNDKRIPENELRVIIKKLNANADYIRDFWIAYHQYEKYIK